MKRDEERAFSEVEEEGNLVSRRRKEGPLGGLAKI